MKTTTIKTRKNTCAESIGICQGFSLLWLLQNFVTFFVSSAETVFGKAVAIVVDIAVSSWYCGMLRTWRIGICGA